MLQKNKKLIFTSFLLIAASILLPSIVFAAGEVPSLGLFGGIFGEATLAQIIIRLIQFFLAVLGFIALVIMLYAGFTWMTAAGDPAKVDKAKKMIQQVVIGLIIIFSAFAITAFIYDRFGPPGGGPGGCVGPECPPPPSCVGPGCTPYWTNYPPEIAYINPALDVLGNTDQRTLAATSTSDDISNGAPGNYVSIVGRYFGNIPGKIFFVSRSDGSRTQAQLAPCARSWSSNLIIALVPAGLTLSGASHEADVATQNPLRNYDVVIEKLASDSSTLTSNIWGFQANSIERPGICSMIPSHGVYPATTTLTGFKFPTAAPRNVVWSISPNFTSSTGSNWSSSTVVDIVPQDLAGRSLVSIFNGESYSNSFLFMISSGRAGSPCGYDTQSCREDITTCDAETDLACQFCSTDPTKPNYTENCNPAKNCTCQPIIDESCAYNADQNLNDKRNCSTGGCVGFEYCSNKGVWSHVCSLPADSVCVPFLGNSSSIAAFSWAFAAKKNPVPGMSCKSEVWNDDTCDLNGCIDSNLACDPLATVDHPACTCVPKNELCTAGKVDTAVCPDAGQCKQIKICQDTGHWGSCVQVNPACVPYKLVPASTIASYSWSFGANNGNGDVGPMVETSCDGSIDCSKNRLPSPSPWSDEWNAANHPELGIKNEKACLNAEIYARFTAMMDSKTISSSTIRLYVSSTSGWIDQTNAKVAEVEPLLSEGESNNADSFAIKLKPGVDLDPSSIYRVFLSNQIRDEVGRNLIDNPNGAKQSLCSAGGSSPTAAAGVCWSFATRPSGPDSICQIGCVNCGPNKYFNRYFGQEKEHKVTPISLDNACISLNNRDYAWDWSEEEQNPGGAAANGWFLQKFLFQAYSWLTDPVALNGIGIASQPADTITTGYGTTTAIRESKWQTNSDYQIWFGADDFDYFRIKGQVKATGNVGTCSVHNNFTDPIVIENQYCSKSDDWSKQVLQSPSPWKGQTDACTNAAIFVLFSRNMQDYSLVNLDGTVKNFQIYKCDSAATDAANHANATSSAFATLGSGCTLQTGWLAKVFDYSHQNISMDELISSLTGADNPSQPEGIIITPPGGLLNQSLSTNSWYKIVIKGGYDGVRGATSTLLESPEGILQVPSANARINDGLHNWYYWYFKTGPSACPIDQVAVLPQVKFMPKIGETQGYQADPYAANCNHLNPNLYKWKWDSLINPLADRCPADNSNPSSGDYVATICQSGESCNPASEPNPTTVGISAVKAYGQNEGNTKITAAAVQGSCSSNKYGAGDLQVGFGGFKVTEHSDSNCLNTDLFINFSQDAKSTSLYDNVKLYQCDDADCLTVSDANLKPLNINYPAGLPLNPLFTNHTYFTPTHQLLPNTTYRMVVKGGQSGVVSAYNTNLLNLNYSLVPNNGGEACDPSLYPWRNNGIDPQAGLCSATCTLTGNLCGTTSAECNPAADPLCDANCHQSGNSNIIASCGNSKIEATENCDDGNIKNGDGCSSHCLLEGSSSAYGSLCGNGKIEKGEACDDGNIKNGDGCSSKCLLEDVINNVLTNVDFENGTVGSAPLNWSVASQSHSKVAISSDYSRSGTKSVKITQDANQPYPGTCNQTTCNDFPAWLKCTWLPATSQCQFNQPDEAHPTTPNPIYNSGESFAWGNTHRVMWGTLYYNVSDLGFKIGQKYVIKFNYKGKIDPQSKLDALFSFNPGWVAQCNQKKAPNLKPDGSCLYGSECSDQPGYCCNQAPYQTKCYTALNLPTVGPKDYGYGAWQEYRTEFTYTSNLAQLFTSAGKLSNTIAISIPYANITGGTDLYIDDFSVERVGSDPNAPICGNGKIEAGEECDSGAANGPANRCASNCLLNGSSAVAAGGTCGNGKLENGQFDSYSWTFTLTDKAQVCQAVNFDLNPCPNGVWSIRPDKNVTKAAVVFYKGNNSNTGNCISDAQMQNLSFWRRIFNQFVKIIKSFLGFRSVIAADWWCPINSIADGTFSAADLAVMRLGNFKKDITIGGTVNNTEVIAYTDDSDNYKINFIRSQNWDTNTEYKAVAVYERKGVMGTSTASVTTYGQSCKMNSVKFDVWPRGLSKTADAFFCASDPATGKPDDCGRSSEDLYDDDMSAPWTMSKAGNGYNLDKNGAAQTLVTADSYKNGNQHLYRVWPLDSHGYVLRANNFLSSLSNIGAAKTTLSEIGNTNYKGDYWTTSGFNPGRSFFDVMVADSDVSAGSKDGSLPIFTYFCNNPWPDAKNFPFIDSSNNCKAGTGSCINTNFGTYYCRDAGQVDSTADDLPSIANYDAFTKTFGSGTGIVMGNTGDTCATLPPSFAIKVAYFNKIDGKAYLWGKDGNVYKGNYSTGWEKVDKGDWQKKGLPANFSPVVGYSFKNATYLWNSVGTLYSSVDNVNWMLVDKKSWTGLPNGFRPIVGYVFNAFSGGDLKIELWDSAGNYYVSDFGTNWSKINKTGVLESFKPIAGTNFIYYSDNGTTQNIFTVLVDANGQYATREFISDWTSNFCDVGLPPIINFKPNVMFYDANSAVLLQGNIAYKKVLMENTIFCNKTWNKIALTDKTCDNKLKEFLFAGGRSGIVINGSTTISTGAPSFPFDFDNFEGSVYTKWGNDNGQADFIYNLNVPLDGQYFITLETANKDLQLNNLPANFNGNYGTCLKDRDLVGNKLYHNIMISIDGLSTSTVKVPAGTAANHQVSRFADKFDLTQGTHKLAVRFLYDCFCLGTFPECPSTDKYFDSNLKIYNIKLNDAGASNVIDAIGLRMYDNNNHYSPELWYKSRFNPGLQGNLEKLSVDGYSAVREGRTVYANAADFSGNQVNVYSGMYLMSYNQGASKATENIYGQMIDNWFFNAGSQIEGGLEYGAALGYCSQGSATEDNKCFTDLDCVKRNAGFCKSDKAKITRDNQRLSDVQDIYNTMSSYYNKLRCSNDFSRTCNTNTDCFGGGVCGNFYPNLRAGTYITGKTYSVWPSWQDELAKTIGAKLPVDPINKFWAWNGASVDCSDPFNAVTCWDQTSRQMVCNLDYNSAVYAYYGTKTGTSTKVYAKGEYNYSTGALDASKAVWKPDWNFVANLNYNLFDGYNALINSGQFCVAASDTCGNGISGETGENCSTCPLDNGCEIGKSCQKISGAWGCHAVVQPPAAVPLVCGNGIIDSGEDCDFINGKPTCGATTTQGILCCTDQCKYSKWYTDVNQNPVCGDGLRTDQEECDCGIAGHNPLLSPAQNNPFTCASLNQDVPTDYSQNPPPEQPFCDKLCQRQDHGNYLFCGDSKVTNGEICDKLYDKYCNDACNGSKINGGSCSNGGCWAPNDGYCDSAHGENYGNSQADCSIACQANCNQFACDMSSGNCFNSCITNSQCQTGYACQGGNCVNMYSLSVNNSNISLGTVTAASGIDCGADCAESYADGTDVILTATPLTGSNFSGWSGDCSGGGTTCVLTMTSNHSVTATFNATPPPVTHTLNVSKSGWGFGKISNPNGIDCGSDCTESYEAGALVGLFAEKGLFSDFGGWSGDFCSTGIGSTLNTCSFFMPNNDVNISANFYLF